MNQDEYYMSLAIAAARVGMSKGNSPFGAVILDSNENIVACGHNEVLETGDPTAHGEIVTIRKATQSVRPVHTITDMTGKVVGHTLPRFLEGCTIYSTAEPCPMCFGAIHWARIERVVYGMGIEQVKGYGFNELTVYNTTLKQLSGCNIKIEQSDMMHEITRLFDDWYKKNGVTY